MSMSWKETKEYIKHDFYRNIEFCGKGVVLKAFFSRYSMLGVLLYYRLCHYFCLKEKKNPIRFLVHCFCYLRFRNLKRQCGIELNQRTVIGYGLRLPHMGGIVIHPGAVVGNNCEIMQGVTIGNNIMKDRDKVAEIGDEVLICAGAKIIGNVHIGNTVVVGANAVVTKDIPDNMIVAGMPAKEIGRCDNRFVINRYEEK